MGTLLDMIAVHGIARLLVVAAIALPSSLLGVYGTSWPIVTAVVVITPLMVVAGVALRAYEIKRDVFSGRIVPLRCSHKECEEPISHTSRIR